MTNCDAKPPKTHFLLNDVNIMSTPLGLSLWQNRWLSKLLLHHICCKTDGNQNYIHTILAAKICGKLKKSTRRSVQVFLRINQGIIKTNRSVQHSCRKT